MRRALALAFLIAASVPATAAAEVRMTDADRTAYPTIRVTVVTSKPTTRVPLLRQNGTPVPTTAQNLGRGANVVTAIDRSRSMNGKALLDATAAVRSFVANKLPDTSVEVIAFGRRPVELTGMAQSRIDAEQALANVGVDKREGTALWDAVVVASRVLSAQEFGGRVLVLLTDGSDTSSVATLASAIAAARRAGVTVYPIGIESKQFSPDALARLARETGGSYHSASSTSSLVKVYAAISRELDRTWRLSYPTAARPGDTLTLDVSVVGLGAAQRRLVLPATLGAVSNVDQKPSLLIPSVVYSNGIGTFFLMLIVGLATLAAVGLVLGATSGKRLRRRIDPHVSARKRKQKATARERFSAADGLLDATENVFSRFSILPRLERMLQRADMPLRAVELFYLCVGAGLIVALSFTIVLGATLVLLLPFAFGVAIPLVFVSFKSRRRLTEIEESLPDLLITLAASLKAGHSFRQGISAATGEDQGPITKELKRVLTETSLGRPMDDALQEMADRVGSKDLQFVITAVTIQRQVGGSLAGIFDLVADTIRQRQQFQRKVRGLTAMGRMSAYTLIGLPFFLGLILTIMNSTYMNPLYTTSIGHMLIVIGLLMMAFGSLILKRIVAFKG
jgi:tight adherence protein B